ncbi:hypothetical protein P171DRAFT_459489 [Karstenula rhodostoma CBS 690.94]|uniref:Bicarbonate transporter-like transmembrane domain-containing protein n=1 Tax=Karstenula rhodostoma CBS 690.94 TaxID=1392251 RepID=A0A9P4PU81_9PLEO|nr:hypothetical protein P171DRAFT_459489 [Karstenula rhodostoma CBS 690.94]
MDKPADLGEEGVALRREITSSYTFEKQQGWRRWHILRPGRGMYYDIRRRLPYYWSDITDVWIYRIFASTVRMYFVNLLPAIAFTLDMYRRTGEFFGINEALPSSALAAMVFSIFACQPLTIVVMAWTGIWAAIFHWIVSFGNLCDYMGYITGSSSESFGTYVGIIYMVKEVAELVNELEVAGNDAGYLSCVIGILYFGSVYGLEKLGGSTLWNSCFRGVLTDYAYVFPTLFWVGFAHIPGHLRSTHQTFVPTSKAFQPTQPRNWVIDFWNLDVGWVLVSLPFGFLTMLLFYYDHAHTVHNFSSLTAQARQFPLKKPAGFHRDLFLLGYTTFVASIMGLPMRNGLVPQAPVHTDSLTNYETRMDVIKTKTHDTPEIRRPVVEATAVVEQGVSHFLMGLALWGTMTRPLLIVLHTMPAAVFAGVFFVIGRFLAPENPLNDIPRLKISLYIGLQIFGVAATVAIGFPVLIIALIPLRIFLMPRWFTRHELFVLDVLTASNKSVLASWADSRPTSLMRRLKMIPWKLRAWNAQSRATTAICIASGVALQLGSA